MKKKHFNLIKIDISNPKPIQYWLKQRNSFDITKDKGDQVIK